MSLSIGQVVNGYELLDYFDSSTKRIAFRARNVTNHRIEQIQILPDSLRDDPERSARFYRESRILVTLNHPNILTCHGVLEIGGHLAIAVEALEAVTLADRLELAPMPVEDAVRSVLQILAAVDAAHSVGVVHREISAANILITPENLVKLTGFCAAKTANDPSVTRAGSIVGSSAYTAPEVFRGSAALDPRIDIYAIGCVFYSLVSGRPPVRRKERIRSDDGPCPSHPRAAQQPQSRGQLRPRRRHRKGSRKTSGCPLPVGPRVLPQHLKLKTT